jgi:tetratricopeptide (TPR) repeat protein
MMPSAMHPDEFTSTVGEAETLNQADGSSPSTERGAQIGRYVVLDVIGMGGMGVVLAAYDPKLDRKVAIKLIRPSFEGARAHLRLQREAQALAKLDHPNVVAVHDVGEHDEQVFVAMDFIQGRDLSAWMAERPRPWPEVLEVFVQAGRGLVAAHAAGLVHRDFKPANVMLGADGRVRVTDFGLARLDLAGAGGRADEPEHGSLLDRGVTVEGSLTGTLAYMSAEQLDGHDADALSDQFAFCVSLFEALYGERPFAARDFASLREAVIGERVREAPPGSGVPGWLRKVVLRGLARDPQQRWPSMQALLDALADDPGLRRRRTLTRVGLLLTLAAASLAAYSLAEREPEPRPCEDLAEPLVGVWDPQRRARLADTFAAASVDHGADTWTRLQPLLHTYAERWVAMRVDACEATVRGEQSSELLDLRMTCLDRKLDHLSATLDELATLDAAALPRAMTSVLALPPLEPCADAAALLADPRQPTDPALAERVEQLESQLTVAWAKQNAGRFADGLAVTDVVMTEADTLGYEPLRAVALRRRGELQLRMGEVEAAQRSLEQSYDAALGQGMLAEAGSSAAALVYLFAEVLMQPDDAQSWARDADPLTRAAGNAERRAAYLDAVASLALLQQRPELARSHFQAALELREAEFGPDDFSVAVSLNNLGVVAEQLGELEQARSYHERTLALREQTLGSQHELVATSHYNLANVASEEHDYAEASRHLEQALAIRERVLGPEHHEVATTLSNLANAEREQGRFDDARRHYERAMAVRERALGPEHPRMVYLWAGLAQVLFEQGRVAEAIPLFDRALVAGEAHSLSPEMLAEVRFLLAQSLWSVPDEALRDRERGRALGQAAREQFASFGEASRERVAAIDAWLAERP